MGHNEFYPVVTFRLFSIECWQSQEYLCLLVVIVITTWKSYKIPLLHSKMGGGRRREEGRKWGRNRKWGGMESGKGQ